MSDQKISELTKITGANLANADEFVVVDVSADQTKAVTRAEFFKNTPNIDIISASATPLHVDRNVSSGAATIRVSNSTHTTYFGTRIGGGFAIDDDADLSSGPWFVIDTSGNVGIGTSSPDAELTVAGDAHLQATSGYSNLYFNGVTDISARYASIRKNYDSPFDLTINASSSGSGAPLIFNSSSAVEAMRIDTSGNVGIGTASPDEILHIKDAETTTGAIMRLQGAAAVAANGRLGDIDFWGGRYSSNTGKTLGQIRVGNQLGAYWDGSPSREVTYMSFSTANNQTLSEAMRIDSSGNVLVGKTAINTAVVGGELRASGLGAFVRDGGEPLFLNRLTSDGAIAVFRKDGTTVGSISVSGSATAYNTSSDYRLKENVTPIQGAADVVMAMQPCTYTAIADGLWYDGFLAHELQEVHPRAVMGTKDAIMDEEYEVTPAVYEDVVTPAVDAVAATYDDEGIELTPAVEAAPETTESVLVTEAVMGTRSVPDMQSVDYSKLTPILTAALQEALTKIDALETRITALEE